MNLNFANQADILRCYHKDENFIEILKNLFVESLQVLDVRTNAKLHNFKDFIGILYYACTSLCNLQTLGEEYMGTIRLSGQRQSRDLSLPSFSRNLLWIGSFFFGEKVLFELLKYLRFTIDSNLKNLLGIIYKLHRILFFVDGQYLHISDRLLSIQYILLKNWPKNPHVKLIFRILSVLSVIVIVTKIRAKQKRMKDVHDEVAASDNNPTVTVATTAARKAGMVRELCVLCSEENTSPACLSCGHIFCWRCVSTLWQSSEQCPICRQFFKPDRVVLLQNYV